jgi:4'-phosphopantetheinyl transferase
VPLTLAPAEPHVWRIPLDRFPPEDFSADLSPEEAARRFRFADHQRRYVCAHGALRRILSRYTGLAPRALQFSAGPHGKPRLDPESTIRFNLSHSGELALVAVAEAREIGVDIEHIRPVDDAIRIARRMFSSAEAVALDALPPAERTVPFFRSWTRMEALLKAAGRGIEGEVSPNNWSLRDLDLAPGYAAALALEGPLENVVILEYGR